MTAAERAPGGRNVDVHAHLVPEAVFARLPRGLRANPMPQRDEIGLLVEGRGAGRGAPRRRGAGVGAAARAWVPPGGPAARRARDPPGVPRAATITVAKPRR